MAVPGGVPHARSVLAGAPPGPACTWVPARPPGSRRDVSAELPLKAPPAPAASPGAAVADHAAEPRRPASSTSGTVGPPLPAPGSLPGVGDGCSNPGRCAWSVERAATPSLRRGPGGSGEDWGGRPARSLGATGQVQETRAKPEVWVPKPAGPEKPRHVRGGYLGAAARLAAPRAWARRSGCFLKTAGRSWPECNC